MKLKSVFFLVSAVFSLAISQPGFAAPTKKKNVKASAKPKCPADHLKAKTCSLEALGLRVQVTESKISIFDGVWRELEDFPYPGEDRQWHEVALRKIGKRDFLEIKLWDKPQGEVGIQSLLWFGYEIKDRVPTAKWKEIIHKRTVIKTPETTEVFTRPKGQFEVPKKTRYMYDKPEKFAIDVDKKGVLHWSVGHRQHNEKDEPKIELKEADEKPKEKTEAPAK